MKVSSLMNSWLKSIYWVETNGSTLVITGHADLTNALLTHRFISLI